MQDDKKDLLVVIHEIIDVMEALLRLYLLEKDITDEEYAIWNKAKKFILSYKKGDVQNTKESLDGAMNVLNMLLDKYVVDNLLPDEEKDKWFEAIEIAYRYEYNNNKDKFSNLGEDINKTFSIPSAKVTQKFRVNDSQAGFATIKRAIKLEQLLMKYPSQINHLSEPEKHSFPSKQEPTDIYNKKYNKVMEIPCLPIPTDKKDELTKKEQEPTKEVRDSREKLLETLSYTSTNIPQEESTESLLWQKFADKFVNVPSGTFMMGSDKRDNERPAHLVTISSSFEIARYQVTQGQWLTIMGSNSSKFQGDSCLPVEEVSWEGVQKFISILNSMTDRYVYRLPTEAEWEYAARAGKTGDFTEDLEKMGWFSSNSSRCTHPVGQKSPNQWGLYDMYGNVWEWCHDWYGYYPKEKVVDPVGVKSGSYRIIRGGCWDYEMGKKWLTFRGSSLPSYGSNIGLRLVRTKKY